MADIKTHFLNASVRGRLALFKNQNSVLQIVLSNPHDCGNWKQHLNFSDRGHNVYNVRTNATYWQNKGEDS